jgi:hypothetical protein
MKESNLNLDVTSELVEMRLKELLICEGGLDWARPDTLRFIT